MCLYILGILYNSELDSVSECQEGNVRVFCGLPKGNLIITINSLCLRTSQHIHGQIYEFKSKSRVKNIFVAVPS